MRQFSNWRAVMITHPGGLLLQYFSLRFYSITQPPTTATSPPTALVCDRPEIS
jgi:hypothetical protein